MKKTLGNYLSQANRDFPLDCETLDYLQTLTDFAAIIGNIAGDKIILYGCEETNEGSRRNEGYVFIRTKIHPEGEVLYWEGGNISTGMYVRQEDIAVSANNINFPKAYTTRSLAPGIGEESYKWEDFMEIKTLKDLMNENNSLRMALANMRNEPLGTIQIWAGKEVPEGYLLCDGSQYRTSEYPELYAALGTNFNSALSANGTAYMTQIGYFRVPDLRGRFIVGLHDNDNDYRESGQAGGDKTVTLKIDQLPSHSHSLKDYYFAEISKYCRGKFDVISTNSNLGSGDCDYDNNGLLYYEHNTFETGKGQSHENRPPYYVMAYIIRAK